MEIASLDKLLEHELKDLYSAEGQLLKALPKMAKAATNPALKKAFTSHLQETKGQVKRLDQVGQILGMKLKGKKCKAMEGLLEEGKEILEAEGDEALLDSAMIGAAQKVEHYEISAYGTARTLAEHMGNSQVAKLLQQTLDEESAADEKLTKISVDQVLPQTDMNGEEDEAPARKRARR